jgi:hypothetical protein
MAAAKSLARPCKPASPATGVDDDTNEWLNYYEGMTGQEPSDNLHEHCRSLHLLKTS